ncbi:S-layer homology domain-containing protein [Vallitalea sp.]|jgi:hypothetical protein|uniref:S-layer homology domain-containing protein n=1 Tax=Vallitalea sp. TaxID=1882829 RepID=UPI0025D6D80F|nr:S-layer homology domain-containing protein [Vallitalea sp.]MCT4686320.1 S-layer homology domain-containing protein [Vallitalea sp.]
MKKKLGLIIILVMLFTCSAYAGGWYPGASDWATEELENAFQNGIDNGYNDYSCNITRVQFAELIMNMYNQMTGKYPNPAPSNTFSDTTNKNVLMANAVGIINGIGNGVFAPEAPITRQEMSIMMSRTLDSMNIDYYKGDGILSVVDKASVANWAVSGVDFAFENGFMKGNGTNFKPLANTPIEQAVIIVNRVFKKYYTKPIEPNDYTKGYDISIENEEIYATFYNNNQKIKIGKGIIYKILESDTSKLYCLDTGIVYRYNFEKNKVDWKYEKERLTYVTLVNGDKYDGYIILTESSMLDSYVYSVFNTDLIEIGKIYKWNNKQDLNLKIEKLLNKYNRETTGSEPFSIKVVDPSQKFKNAIFTKDLIKFYSNPYYSFEDDYLSITPRSSENKNITPIAVLGNDTGVWGYNAYGGIYQVDVCLSSDDDSNAGIVFNVDRIADGYNNFLGFYAGIDAEGNKVMLRRGIGRNNGDWKNISNEKVGFDIKPNEYYTLKVVKNGSSIQVYLNDILYITASDDSFKDDIKMLGLRTWGKSAKFKNYTVNPLPY